MSNRSIEAVRKAIEELRAVERELLLHTVDNGGSYTVPTNEVLQKHRSDNKSWEVTHKPPILVVNYAFGEPGVTPQYPHIQTLTQSTESTLELVDAFREEVAENENDGKVLTYVDFRWASPGVTLGVVDKEETDDNPPWDEESTDEEK